MIRIGIVGHRYLGSPAVSAFVARQCSAILKHAQATHNNVMALSALAEGSDTLFAEAALTLDIPLEIVRPFEAYAGDFTSESARLRHERLCAAARSEVQLPYVHRSDDAYRAAMGWIVTNTDVLVAVWDGRPAEVGGATGYAIEQANRLHHPWIHLNVTDLQVTFHTMMPFLVTASSFRLGI